jgi:uncharacterized protein YkuJ
LITPGCGGGDDSSESDTDGDQYTEVSNEIKYTGLTDKIDLSVGNSEQVIFNAYSFMLSTLSMYNPDFTSRSVETNSYTVDGECGGEAICKIEVNNDNTEYHVTITYDQYCSGDWVYNGGLSVTDIYSDDDSSYHFQEIKFYEYSYSSSDTGYSTNGTLTVTEDESSTLAEIDLVVTNLVTLVQQWIRDGIAQIEVKDEALYYSLSGKYYHSQIGCVDIVTDDELVFGDSEEGYPSTGVFTVEGANGSKSKLDIYSIINYRILNDADGDGDYEYKSEMFFNDISSVSPEEYLESMKEGRKAYFLFDGIWPRVLIFDMDLQSFSCFELDDQPTAFTIDDGEIFISFSESIYKYDLLHGEKNFFAQVDDDVSALFVSDNYLYAVCDSRYITSFNIASGAFVDSNKGEEDDSYYLIGIDYAMTNGCFFANLYGDDDGYISYLGLAKINTYSDGSIGQYYLSSDSKARSYYSSNNKRMFLSPDEGTVVNARGYAFETSNLSNVGEYTDSIIDVDYYYSLPIVLSYWGIDFYNDNFEQTDELEASNDYKSLYVYDKTVFSFYPANQWPGIGADTLSIEDVQINTPDENINTVLIEKMEDNFSRYTSYEIADMPEALAIGDVNGDSLNDVAMVFSSSSDFEEKYAYKWVLLIQNEQNTLDSPIIYDTSTSYTNRANSIEIADLNNDGRNDILIGALKTFEIHLQNESDEFESSIIDKEGLVICSVDYNDDELTDLVEMGTSGTDIRLQKSDNSFDDPWNEPYDSDLESTCNPGDLDGDGDNEISLVNGGQIYDSELGYLYYSLLRHDYSVYHGISDAIVGESAAVGDVYGDSKDEIIVCKASGDMTVLMDDGEKNFCEFATYSTYPVPRAVKIGDVNNDGLNDVIVGHSVWHKVGVYFQDEFNELKDEKLYQIPYISLSPQMMKVGDINNDGLDDIVVADNYRGLVILYQNEPK